MKKILYLDMDNVLVDFESALIRQPSDVLVEFEGRYDEIPDIFATMLPMPMATTAFDILAEHFDTYILSTAPWENDTAWSAKLNWVKDYLGPMAYKRLILTHHKNLNAGHFLVDDRLKNGAAEFRGQHIHFGTELFPDWETTVKYLLERK